MGLIMFVDDDDDEAVVVVVVVVTATAGAAARMPFPGALGAMRFAAMKLTNWAGISAKVSLARRTGSSLNFLKGTNCTISLAA